MEASTGRITARIVDIGDLDEVSEGYCLAHHILELHVGEQTLRVAGWVLAGWLAPGASADLDGSGLANWGSSQPGGWSVCEGDGVVSGRVAVGARGELADPIGVRCHDGYSEGAVTPEMIPEWSAALAAVAAAKTTYDKAEAAYQAAATADEPATEAARDVAWDALEAAEVSADRVRDSVIADIERAIAAAYADADDLAPEPDAETVWNDLARHGIMEADGTDLIRLGDFRGAGLCLAWATSDGHDFAWWPTEGDVDTAVEATSSVAAAEIASRLRILCEED